MRKKKVVKVIRRSNGEVLLDSVLWCASSLCKFRGLQFRSGLQSGEGLILVHKKDSVAQTSIHMFFVFFPIAVVWISQDGIVTHKVLAKPWRPYYASPSPASYVLETTPAFLEKIEIGEEIDFREVD